MVSIQEKNENVLNAVISGMNQGVVYVDQIRQPRTAMVYAVGLEYFLFGDPENESFNSHLSDLISRQLKQESLDLCGGTWFCARIFNENWKETLEKVVDGRRYYVDYRVYFNRISRVKTVKLARMLVMKIHNDTRLLIDNLQPL